MRPPAAAGLVQNEDAALERPRDSKLLMHGTGKHDSCGEFAGQLHQRNLLIRLQHADREPCLWRPPAQKRQDRNCMKVEARRVIEPVYGVTLFDILEGQVEPVRLHHTIFMTRQCRGEDHDRMMLTR